jgi:hypothetical protein
MAKVPRPKRGEIWFDPSVGAGIRKRRLAVVVNFDGTGPLPLHFVVPIMDWKLAFADFPFDSVFPREPPSGGRSQRKS